MAPTSAPPRWIARSETLDRWDRRATRLMAQRGPDVARISLGLVFVWFGALKMFGVTPVADLVGAAIPWLPQALVVPALGVFEVAVGLLLLFGIGLRIALLLLTLQLLGTFSVLVLLPQVAFQGGNPLLLTVEGEFVVKNLVLIAAAILVGGSLRQRRSDERREADTRAREA